MTRSVILPDFTRPQPKATPEPVAAAPVAPATSEEEKLAAFDRGYKSGWDDCATAEAEERASVGADLARTISDATLTYDAARRDILAALGPLFEQISSTLLPRMAAEAVAPAVVAELQKLAEGQLDAEVELHAAPAACASLQWIVEKETIGSLKIRPEPAFSEGQVSLRLGQERRDIDMSAAAERIAAAISAFQDQSSDLHASEDHNQKGAA